MLLTLLTGLTPSLSPADLAARPQAAQQLEDALALAREEVGAGRSALAALEAGIDEARGVLGPDSEISRELARQARGACFEAFLAGDDGAAWLAERLAGVVSDLRFEMVREADLPAGFPEPTPVGEIRVQHYPASRMARTGVRDASDAGAFWRLFAHIQENDVAMTAPVETIFAGGEADLAASSMAFLYGSPSLGSAGAPGPVEVVDVPPHSAVSIGLRGVDAPQSVATARRKLERWIAARPRWRPAGPLRTMGYNSPMVRGDRRYFEVQIPVESSADILIDFSDPAEADRWQVVDDVVMGGRSSSRMVGTSEEATAFTGELSLENNGGFASVRTAGERCSLAGASAVILRVRGDGRAYRLRCRTDDRFDGTSYQATFGTRAGEWLDVTLELCDFVPKWRGRLVADAPPLDPAAVRGLGLMIADGREGPFRLELRSLAKVP